MRQLFTRIFMGGLIAISLSQTIGAEESSDLDKPVATESRSAEWKKFDNYKDWKPLNAEPIAIPRPVFTTCVGERIYGENDPKRHSSGGFVTYFVNPAGRANYLAEKHEAYAPGTVIVKEKRSKKDAKEPDEIGVMIKREAGHDQETGDWEFLFVDHHQKLITVADKLSACRDCHGARTEGDHVFGPKSLAKSAKKP